MTTFNEPIASSRVPDLKLLRRLLRLQVVCCAVAGCIAVVILLAWLVPAIGNLLPAGWALMKSNTALSVLLVAVSLLLTESKTANARRAGKTCAIVVAVIGAATLVEYLVGRSFGLDTLLAADAGATTPGRMAVQTAGFLGLAGIVVACGRTSLRFVADVATVCLIGIVLLVVVGYAFHTVHLIGQSQSTRTSPQTLVSVSCLAVAISVQRLSFGFFSLLLGTGIGSQVARTGLPFAVLSPLVILSGTYATQAGLISAPYAGAATAAVSSLLFVIFVLLIAQRINVLESALRDSSLLDELTKIHNRRGFYHLGEHLLVNGRRAGDRVSVLFFDIDGLKAVNDSLGHDVGSRLLLEFANLLRAVFRASDVVARVGGDEFAVAMITSQGEGSALTRLYDAVAAANASSSSPFQIHYSAGEAIAKPTDDVSLAELVARADAGMYEAKSAKHSAPALSRS